MQYSMTQPIAQNIEIEYTKKASIESVITVVKAKEDEPDGRSAFFWAQTTEGDWMLCVFPHGATFEEVEYDF